MKPNTAVAPHVSVDAFVRWRGLVLLIRRQDGTWALPGGFVDPGEQLLDVATLEFYADHRQIVAALRSGAAIDSGDRKT